MELKDFVTAALRDVQLGIVAAQEDERVGSLIAPSWVGVKDVVPADSGVYHRQRLLMTVVKFDVAVTASDEGTVSGAAGVKVFGAKLGTEGETSTRHESVSRIEFAVHVMLPPNKKNWNRLADEADAAFKADSPS